MNILLFWKWRGSVAWLCLDCFSSEADRTTDETLQFFFSTKRNVLRAQAPPPPPPTLHLLLILLKEGPLYRWERFYICNRGGCNMFFCCCWNLSELFPEYQNPKLVTYLLTYNGTFSDFFGNRTRKKKKKRNSNLQMNVFEFPQGGGGGGDMDRSSGPFSQCPTEIHLCPHRPCGHDVDFLIREEGGQLGEKHYFPVRNMSLFQSWWWITYVTWKWSQFWNK